MRCCTQPRKRWPPPQPPQRSAILLIHVFYLPLAVVTAISLLPTALLLGNVDFNNSILYCDPLLGLVRLLQAKKREKKKNAAKESVVEPSKDNKSAGVDGAGTESKAAASGVKRAEGGEKDKAAGVTVERSKALGQKVWRLHALLSTVPGHNEALKDLGSWKHHGIHCDGRRIHVLRVRLLLWL